MLLQDFHSNRIRNLQIADIEGHIIEFAVDRRGSRFIQKKLNHTTVWRKTNIYLEMRPKMVLLMKHQYANFVVQHFFDCDNQFLWAQLDLVAMIRQHFMELCLHPHGRYVVQIAIERMAPQQQISMVGQCTNGEIIRLANDANGNHILQTYFQHGNVDVQVGNRLVYFIFESSYLRYIIFWWRKGGGRSVVSVSSLIRIFFLL